MKTSLLQGQASSTSALSSMAPSDSSLHFSMQHSSASTRQACLSLNRDGCLLQPGGRGGGGNVTGRGGQSSWHHGPKPTTMTRKKLCAAQPARAQLRPHVNRSHYVNTLVHHYMIRVICSATTYYTSTPTVEKLACSYLGSIASALPCKQQNKLDGVQGTLRRQIFLCMQI